MNPVIATILAILVLVLLFVGVIALILIIVATKEYFAALPVLGLVKRITTENTERIDWAKVEINGSTFKWPSEIHFTCGDKSYVLEGVVSTAFTNKSFTGVRESFVIRRKQPTIRINGSLKSSSNTADTVVVVKNDNVWWGLTQKKIFKKIDNIAHMENI